MKSRMIEVTFNFSGFEYAHDELMDTVLNNNGLSNDQIFDINFTSEFYNNYIEILHENMEDFIIDKYFSNKHIDNFMEFSDFRNKPYGGTIDSRVNLKLLRILYNTILKNSVLKANFDDLLREYRTSGAYKCWNASNKLHLWEPTQLGLIIETLLINFDEFETMINNSDVLELIYQFCDNLPE
jgi:hypothetical protein